MSRRHPVKKRTALILTLCLCFAAGTGLATSPMATERIRFETAGLSLALPLDWMYMDLTEQFLAEQETIAVYGMELALTGYVMMANTAGTITVTMVAVENSDDIDAEAEMRGIITSYGDAGVIREVAGVPCFIFPYEGEGIGAVCYTDENMITLHAYLQDEENQPASVVAAFTAQFEAILGSMKFFEVTK